MKKEISGQNIVDYKTYDNKKLATFWLTYNNIWNFVVIILMLSATISIHTALKEHSLNYNWALYTMYGILGAYALFYVTVLALSSADKDESKALKKIIIFRRLAVTMRSILEIFYVVLLLMLGENVGDENNTTAGWSYFAAATLILRNALAIARQILMYFLKRKMDKKKEERKAIRKVYVSKLKKDVQKDQILLEQRKKEVEAHKKSMQFRLWSLYNDAFVKKHEVGIEKEIPVEVQEVEEVVEDEVKVIYTAPEVEKEPMEHEEDIVVEEDNVLDAVEERYLYDAPEVAADVSTDDSDIFMSLVEIVSDYSGVFDFPDGTRRSDD